MQNYSRICYCCQHADWLTCEMNRNTLTRFRGCHEEWQQIPQSRTLVRALSMAVEKLRRTFCTMARSYETLACASARHADAYLCTEDGSKSERRKSRSSAGNSQAHLWKQFWKRSKSCCVSRFRVARQLLPCAGLSSSRSKS